MRWTIDLDSGIYRILNQKRAEMSSFLEKDLLSQNEVYSHLHTFFSRYYDKGGFISQRRYKARHICYFLQGRRRNFPCTTNPASNSANSSPSTATPFDRLIYEILVKGSVEKQINV